jgi:hypothetical protein
VGLAKGMFVASLAIEIPPVVILFNMKLTCLLALHQADKYFPAEFLPVFYNRNISYASLTSH